MLTRIELDGFKSFEGFSMDLGPHAVVLGPNGAGKSNLFDAIRFLSALADGGVADAARDMRGQPHELFSFDGMGQPGKTMKLAVEVLLPKEIKDPWGNAVSVKHSRMRYEIGLERRTEGGTEKLVVTEEFAHGLSTKAKWAPYLQPVTDSFHAEVVRRARAGAKDQTYLETSANADGHPVFKLKQDGPGRPRELSASGADATILSSISSAEFKHLFALREELRSWRFFQLDPVAIRDTRRSSWSQQLESDGRNLGRVLNRIRARTRSPESPEGVLPDIANDLAELVDGVRGIQVDEDKDLGDFRIRLQMGGDTPYSSHLLSDGTLRLLALLTLLNDPDFNGLLCMEEPENGVHPQRLVSLIRHLRDHVTDPFSDDPVPGEPLQQVLTNSHSPVVLSAVRDRKSEAFFADTVTLIDPATSGRVRRTRIRPVVGVDQGEAFSRPDAPTVSSFEVEQFLKTVKTGA